MADQNGRDGVIQLGGEILHVHAVVRAHLDQNRHAIGMHDGRGHGGKGEGRDQHPCPAWQVQRLQRQEQRRGTARNRQRVACCP